MKDLLYFESMITPKIITFLYWLMLVGALLFGLFTIFSGFSMMRFSFFGGLGTVFGGLLSIALGALLARVYCELMIVLFKMNEALQELRRKP